MRSKLIAAALALVLGSSGPVAAGPSNAQKCAAAKIKSAGKKGACLLGLYAKQEATGIGATTASTQKCKNKLSATFAKSEAKGGCVTTGDAPAIESKVDTFVGDVDGMLLTSPPGPPSKCNAAKLKSAGKKAACLLGLEAKEATGSAADPPKMQQCHDKLSAAFAKNESKGGCATTGDAAAVEGRVDLFVDDVVAEEPAATMTSTSTSTSTSSTTSTTIVCPCCSNTKLFFTVGTIDSTNCGVVKDDSGTKIIDLACDGLYFGGGADSVPLPATIPDYGASQYKIVSCDSGTQTYGITFTTNADSGSNRNCTSATVSNPEYPTRPGCLYGAPLPIPNATTPGLSTCVINRVTTNASGSGTCAGAMDIDIPLGSDIYLTGDLLTGVSGIQPCPICTPGACTSGVCCQGGPNDGMDCVAGSSNLGAAYPTSHDCPPPHNTEPCDGTVTGGCLGTLPIGYQLTTGTSTKTAVDFASTPAQSNVFCGFCGNGFGGFQGSSTTPAVPCTADAQCTSAPNTKCRQKTPGAFGTNLSPGVVARTIAETGTPSGCLAGGGSLPTTLVSVFCIPPTFNPAVDSAADLPGPGAAALKGAAQLMP
jgi:hypothetical protein